MKRIALYFAMASVASAAFGIDNPGITFAGSGRDCFALVGNGRPAAKIVVECSEPAVKIAARNLAMDFERVTGSLPPEESDRKIVVRIDPALKGKRETYVMKITSDAIIVSGSDRRGAVYGIYELSEQLGVSPWYDWADAPLRWKAKNGEKLNLSIKRGTYTNGEPAVRYRGIFLNDEAPCLTGWVKNTYGTDFGDRRFYARVGELVLRLRGNFIWPAMWCWAFYADDPENSKTLDEMGVIVGTSHHEPMARNHQEYARRRKEIGAWNYRTNKDALDKFFAEGVRRMKTTEDVVTIGMRGDGDVEMDGNGDMELMKSIIANQRAIIERETGKNAADVPQVWALYKEVQDYFDKGLRPPEDVTILLCDDNWGNVRMLPRKEERNRLGGWGMYYHVDYVGAPRNSKFLNVTSAASMWEQMSLAYEYGVDRLWVLNVGDLKPMEYPITLFLDMAWNPSRYTPKTLGKFTERFCAGLFGAREAKEAARILDLTSRWACRCTPELLNKDTYDLKSGEWAKVAGDYARLAKEAEAQYARLPAYAKDAYFEIVLFHVKVMANLYGMYYAQAMNAFWGNGKRGTGNREQEVNAWADRVEECFRRHGELCDEYNLKVAGGKWNGMMNQKVIGYTSWNDGFHADTCPKVVRTGAAAEEAAAAERAAKLLAANEPRIYSSQRSKSYDANLGENWWMRRHDAMNELLKPLADGKTIVWTDWSGFFTLDDGRLRPGLNDDGLHPNAKGYAEWVKVALPVWRAACEFGRAGVPPPAADGDGTPSLPRLKSVSSHVVTIEANRFAKADAPKGFCWEFIPGLGYGEGAMEVLPRIAAPTGAKLSYNVAVPSGAKSVEVTVVTRSTLAFARPEGHRYSVAFGKGGEPKIVNFNARLNEKPENIYSVYYPTIARRVVRQKVRLDVPSGASGSATLELSPLDQGIAFEQVLVDWQR